MVSGRKVCHISFSHSPFDDRIYWKELMALKENGYLAIHIATGEKDDDYFSKEGIRIITVRRRKIHKIPWLNKVLQLMTARNSTINIIYKKAASLQANVYHYHDLQLNILSKKLKQLPHHPKVIYDAHEAYHLLMLEDAPYGLVRKSFYKIYIRLVKRWEQYYASFCDRIIVTDEYSLQYFKRSAPLVPCNIIFNYSYFLPDDTQHQQKKYHFIYPGLLSKSRGIEEIIRSISCLKKDISSVKALLIGTFENNEFKSHIQRLIQELNLMGNIVLKEAVPFHQISLYYQQSFIGLGLFHKTPKYTTFIPIKLFEYMAFGLPQIFCNYGPSAEIITNSNSGILVNPLDTNEVCLAMKTLLKDKNLYTALSKNAMKAVQEKYNWQVEKEKLLKIYAELLASD
jgi:glycosyltransferase involved in cell wall biosynthesis